MTPKAAVLFHLFLPLRLRQGVLHVRYVLEGAHGLSEKFVNRSAIFRLVYWRVTIPKYRTCVNLHIHTEMI